MRRKVDERSNSSSLNFCEVMGVEGSELHSKLDITQPHNPAKFHTFYRMYVIGDVILMPQAHERPKKFIRHSENYVIRQGHITSFDCIQCSLKNLMPVATCSQGQQNLSSIRKTCLEVKGIFEMIYDIFRNWRHTIPLGAAYIFPKSFRCVDPLIFGKSCIKVMEFYYQFPQLPQPCTKKYKSYQHVCPRYAWADLSKNTILI